MTGFGYVTSEGALPSPNYDVGDVIEYRVFGGAIRRVLVSEKYADVKNGEPGFSGTQVGPGDEPYGCWGYTHQITAVIKTVRGDAA